MKVFITWLFFLTMIASVSLAQRKISGRVITQEDQVPLSGASIWIKGTYNSVQSGSNGEFNIVCNSSDSILVISYIGYVSKETLIAKQSNFLILLQKNMNQLQEVTISTGYQTLSKERAAGSFVQIDNDLINRRVSTDIVSRLEDVTSGLLFNFNPATGKKTDLNIRGQSTIFSNTQPLIVVDNFPFSGDLNSINPNDVESITILKDAAAASIWGARSGNGVIVITTKRGGYNRKPSISFNSNFTVSTKPNLFYESKMSSSDFITVETDLFKQGFYTSAEQSDNHLPLTPVVEVLIAERDKLITADVANQQINLLRNYDVRKDLKKYFYRNGINQQYALNISGGSDNNNYYVSAGVDKNLDALTRNDYNRITLTASNTYSLLKDRLKVSASFYLSKSKVHNNNGIADITFGTTGKIYPYAQLADQSGNALPVFKDFRKSFIESNGQQGLLDWDYYPINELNIANKESKSLEYRLNTDLKYKLTSALDFQVLYQYSSSSAMGRNLADVNTYNTRNSINNFTILNTDGTIKRNLPYGGILDLSNSNTITNNLRAMLNYKKEWGTKNEITALAGYEVSDAQTLINSNRLYGYDSEHATAKIVDYTSLFNVYSFPGAVAQIPYADSEMQLTDRYLSYFGNAGYSYDRRYLITASIRRDESNIFGVNTNQKGVPLYAAGLGWTVSKEKFYTLNSLPLLKLRASYGYNGNVNKSLSAYTSGYYYERDPLTRLPYVQITNPPNPELKWERVRIINFGIDFSGKNGRIGGSLEWYSKKGTDLIGVSPMAPSTGVEKFQGNYASTIGKGVDVILNSINLEKEIKWTTNLLFSYNNDKVTKYEYDFVATNVAGNIGNPIIGKPLYSIYSYKFAGLDEKTGDPQGYINNIISKDYAEIINTEKIEELTYSGSARPVVFGSVRNNFSWRNLSFSFNISYRLGYYFRKSSVAYYDVLSGIPSHGDFAKRWQEPGDEKVTIIPSMPAAIDYNRDSFFLTSDALVDKADNIRLQDITINYAFNNRLLKMLSLKHAEIYFYMNNIGLLWKANKFGIDPDYQTIPLIRTYALGLKINL